MWPLCPGCPPGFLSVFARRLFGFGLLYPSEEGGLELLVEFMVVLRVSSLTCSCRKMIIASLFAIASLRLSIVPLRWTTRPLRRMISSSSSRTCSLAMRLRNPPTHHPSFCSSRMNRIRFIQLS